MRLFSSRPSDLLRSCGVIVAAYLILHLIMERTRMIEKVMSLNFSWWELLLITGFLVTRLLTYLLVPSVIAALTVRWLAHTLLRNKS